MFGAKGRVMFLSLDVVAIEGVDVCLLLGACAGLGHRDTACVAFGDAVVLLQPALLCVTNQCCGMLLP